MPRSSHKLDALAALLERTGGDPKRIEAVRRAQNFRRSWIDLAETLCRIRNNALYERWGFEDFHTYCQDELTLKRATVDKLTISYSTLERHAPQVLERDGVASTIPSYEAIDYFQKTVGGIDEAEAEPAANDEGAELIMPRRRSRLAAPPTPELRRELEDAVFNEGQPVAELRKRFDPVFFPKPSGAEDLERIKRASATARKLAELLAEIPGLPDKQARRVEAELGKLRETLDELAEPLKEKVTAATARAEKKLARAREQLRVAEDGEAKPARAPAKPKAKAKAEPATDREAAPRKRKRTA